MNKASEYVISHEHSHVIPIDGQPEKAERAAKGGGQVLHVAPVAADEVALEKIDGEDEDEVGGH